MTVMTAQVSGTTMAQKSDCLLLMLLISYVFIPRQLATKLGRRKIMVTLINTRE